MKNNNTAIGTRAYKTKVLAIGRNISNASCYYKLKCVRMPAVVEIISIKIQTQFSPITTLPVLAVNVVTTVNNIEHLNYRLTPSY